MKTLVSLSRSLAFASQKLIRHVVLYVVIDEFNELIKDEILLLTFLEFVWMIAM